MERFQGELIEDSVLSYSITSLRRIDYFSWHSFFMKAANGDHVASATSSELNSGTSSSSPVPAMSISNCNEEMTDNTVLAGDAVEPLAAVMGKERGNYTGYLNNQMFQES